MKLNIVTPLAFLLLSSSTVFAQAAGNAIYGNTRTGTDPRQRAYQVNDSTMVLDVDVMMNVKADSYVAIFALTQVGSQLDSTNIMMNARIDGFIKDLKGLGISQEDFYTDLVSQIPTYAYEVQSKIFSRTYNEVPVGFELKKNVHIGFKRAEMADDILMIAAKYEIYDIVKVNYVVNNTESIYDSLRSVAVRSMGRKIRDFEKMGIKFTSHFQTVGEVVNSTSPIEHYANYTAFGAAQTPAIRKSLLGSTTVNTAQKPVTLYYNGLPANNYDTVINPKVVEPVVQFTYKLSVRYVLKRG